MLDDTVEATAPLRVATRLAEGGQPERVHAGVEVGSGDPVEQRHASEVLGSGLIGKVQVRDTDAVNDSALEQCTLIDTRMQLQGCDRDVAPHRLPVDDRPSGPAYFADEEVAYLKRVLHEPV